MSKTKIDGLPGWEIEPPSQKVIEEDKRRYVNEGFDLLEGEAAQASKKKREEQFFEAYGIRPKEPPKRGFTDQEIREGKDLRMAMFDKALGVKQAEKKVADEKKLKEKKPEPFGDLKAQLRELSESLAREGIKYTPLIEFQAKLESWSDEVNLKESDADDLGGEFATVKKSSERIAEEVRNFRKRKN